MSTRCSISIQNEDLSIDSIYCHQDGGLKFAGKFLLKHYDTTEKVKELISLGDISSLGTTTVAPPDYDSRILDLYTVSYHRWRNDRIDITHLPSQV